MKRLTVVIALMPLAVVSKQQLNPQLKRQQALQERQLQRRRMKRRPMTRYRHRRWRSRTVITQRSSRRTAACSMSMKRRTEKASLL